VARKIVICGYYGFDNAGDELILLSLVKGLREMEEDLRITVLSSSPSETALRFGVESVNRWSPFAVVASIMKTDMLVFGGGGIFQDISSSASIAYYLCLVGLARMMGKKVVLLSQGIGPISRGITRRIAKVIIQKSSLIVVRDAQSEKELGKMGITRPVIRAGTDLLFNLKPRITEKTEDSFVIGVSLQQLPSAGRLYENIKDICLKLVLAYRARIIFMPFHLRRDAVLSGRIAESVKGSELFLWKAPKDILDVYNRIDAVIGMRLHSLILACLYGKPCIAIVKSQTRSDYDPKIKVFLDSVGMQERIFSETDLSSGDCVARIAGLLRGRGDFSAASPALDRMVERSASNLDCMRGAI